MSRKDLKDLGLFDCSDVSYEILESKRLDRVTIVLTTDGRFNLIKIFLALKMIVDKLETEINVLDEVDGEH